MTSQGPLPNTAAALGASGSTDTVGIASDGGRGGGHDDINANNTNTAGDAGSAAVSSSSSGGGGGGGGGGDNSNSSSNSGVSPRPPPFVPGPSAALPPPPPGVFMPPATKSKNVLLNTSGVGTQLLDQERRHARQQQQQTEAHRQVVDLIVGLGYEPSLVVSCLTDMVRRHKDGVLAGTPGTPGASIQADINAVLDELAEHTRRRGRRRSARSGTRTLYGGLGLAHVDGLGLGPPNHIGGNNSKRSMRARLRRLTEEVSTLKVAASHWRATASNCQKELRRRDDALAAAQRSRDGALNDARVAEERARRAEVAAGNSNRLLSSARRRIACLEARPSMLMGSATDPDSSSADAAAAADAGRAMSLAELRSLEEELAAAARRTSEALVKRLTTAHDALAESRMCIVCEAKRADVLLLPCRHHVMCGDCAKRVDRCPLDRSVISRKVTSFGR